MRMLQAVREAFKNLSRSAQLLAEIREGVANFAELFDRRVARSNEELRQSLGAINQTLLEIREGVANQTNATCQGTAALVAGLNNQSKLIVQGTGGLSTPSRSASGPLWGQAGTATDLGHSKRGLAPNQIESFADAFSGIEPWSGTPAQGFFVDWLGTLTDASFRSYLGVNGDTVGGRPVNTRLPVIEDGEGWFEAVNWVEAARDARGTFTMITLGACYGAQAVGSYMALQKLNPMAAKLVAVEPEPVNQQWVAKHFRDNGINPDDHWLVGAAISASNRPVFFPVGAPGTGAQNCFSTNEDGARESYVEALAQGGKAEAALRNLLLHNTTGLKKDLVPGEPFEAEITVMSSITLNDVLSPFSVVDFLEADMQQSEIVVFPPFMDLLKRKVRRVHIGTHGGDVHAELVRLLKRDGWEIIFDYAPNGTYQTPLGSFSTNDGVLSARNPSL